MNNTNNYSARQSYDIARQILFNSWIQTFLQANGGPAGAQKATSDCWKWVDGRKLSQSQIRLETELTILTSTFTFGLNPQQQNSSNVKFNTENRLNQQDSLIVSEYGIYVGKPASQVDTAWRLRTYGNTIDFTAGAAEDIDTQFFCNGFYVLKVNNDVVMPYRGLFNHWYIPQTQQTAAIGPASPKDQIRGAEDGLITAEPNLLLIGSKNYVPQIVLPANLNTADAFERAIILYDGILAQNSTVVN